MLVDALVYADMHSAPDGRIITTEARLADISRRHPGPHQDVRAELLRASIRRTEAAIHADPANRTVRLLAPLSEDLAGWRKYTDQSTPAELVFPRPDGQPWKDTDFRNWRRRRFEKSAEEVGLKDVVPYDLRHSFASLLLHEQINAAEVAAQLGHSLQTLLGTYAHVIDEWREEKPIKAEAEIRKARKKVLRGRVPT